MNYGLDNFVSQPPIGAISSLFMICGLDALGLLILKVLRFDLTDKKDFWLRFQSPLIGTAALLFIASPIVLVGFFKSGVPIIFAYFLGLLGLKHLIVNFSRWKSKGLVATLNIKHIKLMDWSVIIILFAFTLLSWLR